MQANSKFSQTLEKRIAIMEEQIEDREYEIALLKETSHAVSSEVDLDKILVMIAERACILIQAETLLVPILDMECSQYTYRAGVGKNAKEIIGESLPLDYGICGWVWENRRPWWRGVLEELEEDQKTRWENEAGSVLLVPLVGKKHFLGGLAGINKADGGEFNDRDLDLLEMFASQVSVAIENAILFDELQQLNSSLEQRVKDRTADLTMLNYELESFSYSVSHDLRAPLRHVEGFGRALDQEYRNQLDVKGRDYIHRIRESCNYMGILIDNLLKLSRVGRQEITAVELEFSELVYNVCNEKRVDCKNRDIEFNVQPNVDAVGDANLLSIVVTNLVDNAIKYSKLREKSIIDIGAVNKENGETIYYVRDNGVGFDMKYIDKLFTVFQRLHSVDEFDGTGIGLATVSRIIQRHGGRVWAESEVDKGATFYFTLGQRPSVNNIDTAFRHMTGLQNDVGDEYSA